MKPILCYCHDCRRHHATRRAMVQSRRKAQRSFVRQQLRLGHYDNLPTTFYVGYTDWPLHPCVIRGA